MLVSCRLSSTGLGFLSILFPPEDSASLTVGLPDRHPGGLDSVGVPMFRTRETRPGWGRVAGTHCCVPATSEPDLNAFHSSGSSKPYWLVPGNYSGPLSSAWRVGSGWDRRDGEGVVILRLPPLAGSRVRVVVVSWCSRRGASVGVAR